MSTELKAKLAQLKELHELGLLDLEAYRQQQQALVASAMGTTPAATASPLSGATRVETSTAPAPPATDLLSGATTADPSAGLPARLGSYRVLGVIGAGGMGTVVRARHDSDGWARRQGGDVAIKLIHPHIAADPAFQERFFDEAELGRRIQHPGLARVYDVVTEGPWLGTVLELIEGRELSDWVRPGGLPVDEVLSLLTPLAEALDHLHGQGIVHRDLKPANVKVRPDGGPALLDLGIAKDLSGESSGQTKTMTTMGTSAWMAPEQADAKSVTAAADVYAFGLLAYALLSGRMPWGEGESELRVLTNKMMGKLAPLSSVKPELPRALSDAVMRALSVEPARRPSPCSAVLQAQATRVRVTHTEQDELYGPAVAAVVAEGTASTAFIQRRFKVGHGRAVKLLERMAREGVSGVAESLERQRADESKGAAEQTFKRGVAALREGQLRNAHELFESASTRLPHAPEVRAYLGFTTHRLNRSTDEPAADRGVEMVKVVLAGHKELDSVWVLMGRIMRDRGNEGGAARCFQQALRLNPSNADAVHEMRQGAGGGSGSGKSGGLLSRWFGGGKG